MSSTCPSVCVRTCVRALADRLAVDLCTTHPKNCLGGILDKIQVRVREMLPQTVCSQ